MSCDLRRRAKAQLDYFCKVGFYTITDHFDRAVFLTLSRVDIALPCGLQPCLFLRLKSLSVCEIYRDNMLHDDGHSVGGQ
jgi:hypothetical protein